MNTFSYRILLLLFLLGLSPIIEAQTQSTSSSALVGEVKERKENWFSRTVNAHLGDDQQKPDRQVDEGWRVKPGLAFRWKRKGTDWSIGPRLSVSKRTSRDGKLTLNGQFLPIRFTDLKDGSRLNYSRFDIGYRHFLSPKLFVGAGYALHQFSPSGAFQEEVAARGGTVGDRNISAASLSVGQQVFKIAWSYRGRQRVWPFFLELSYQAAEDYKYGADLGQAGSEFNIKSGFSFRLRPLTRRF